MARYCRSLHGCLIASASLSLPVPSLFFSQSGLKDGYAPFCKHLFIPASHFGLQVPCAYAEITDANKAQLESLYSARTDKELPVLTRFFSKSDNGQNSRGHEGCGRVGAELTATMAL